MPPEIGEQLAVVVLVRVEAELRQRSSGRLQRAEGLGLAAVQKRVCERGRVADERAEMQVIALRVRTDHGGLFFHRLMRAAGGVAVLRGEGRLRRFDLCCWLSARAGGSVT